MLFLGTFTTSEFKELKQHFTLQPENKVSRLFQQAKNLNNFKIVKYVKHNFVAPEYLLI